MDWYVATARKMALSNTFPAHKPKGQSAARPGFPVGAFTRRRMRVSWREAWTGDENSPFMVDRKKSAITALFRADVDLATQDRMVNGFRR